MKTDRLATREPFGLLLRRFRLAAGLSQESLAERAGVSWRTISDLERGVKQAPRRSTLRLLADGLAVSPEDHAALQASAYPTDMEPEPRPPATVPTNLPLALTSFVGRARAVATVRRLLGETRLLTLTGAGGCGKTRLALEVARTPARDAHERAGYADGVWLVELAALREEALVPQSVATVLGVREHPGQPLLDSLIGVLQSKQVLLLLDNCEHLVMACAELAEALLRSCSRLTILATSREALGIGGERRWHVPSLSLPDAQAELSPEQTLAYDAVRLFLDRAQVVRPDFVPTREQVGLVAQVCRRLDGLPLAIELAAVRLATLSLDQLVARLDDRFRLLSGGNRTALPRQQTLRAALDWSYDLLSAPERLLLRRLAVFAGGWTLEAAEEVCAGEGLAPEEVLELLAGLVAKSLVLVEEWKSGGHYRLLETVRQYGWEKLLAAGEDGWVQDRRLDWCLALARQAERSMGGPEQEGWLARLEAELENLRAALAWSGLDESRRETGLRLAEALRWFWVMRGYLSEGQQWLADGRHDAGSAALRARGLDALAELVWHQGESARALTLFEESFALHRQAGQSASAAHALLAQGMVTTSLGDYRRATVLIEEALPLLRAQGERHGVGWALGSLGVLLHLQGDYARATERYEESLALFQELGDKFGSGNQLASLARVARELGNGAEAQRLYRESLQAFGALLDKQGCAACFEGLAMVAANTGQPERAARLLGAARRLRGVTGTVVHDVDRTVHDRTVTHLHAVLTADTIAAAWAAGEAMGLEEAIAYVLQEGEPA